MPKYEPRHLPPKEEAALRELGMSAKDMAAQLDYIAMMADVDLETMNIEDEDDGIQQEVQ